MGSQDHQVVVAVETVEDQEVVVELTAEEAMEGEAVEVEVEIHTWGHYL